jgi:hypothetical protein
MPQSWSASDMPFKIHCDELIKSFNASMLAKRPVLFFPEGQLLFRLNSDVSERVL